MKTFEASLILCQHGWFALAEEQLLDGIGIQITTGFKPTKTEAEQELIKYGLSIAPKKERDILTKAAKSDYVTKMKIVELVMRLDASTVA